MRSIFVGLTMLIAASAADPASAEILYPWCRLSADGGTNCGFSTFEQCQSFGKGAFCMKNPNYQEPASPAPGRRPKGR